MLLASHNSVTHCKWALIVLQLGGSARVSFHQFFMGATVNIIWRLSTGQKLAYDDPKLLDVSHKIYHFFKFLRPGPNSFLQLQV